MGAAPRNAWPRGRSRSRRESEMAAPHPFARAVTVDRLRRLQVDRLEEVVPVTRDMFLPRAGPIDNRLVADVRLRQRTWEGGGSQRLEARHDQLRDVVLCISKEL